MKNNNNLDSLPIVNKRNYILFTVGIFLTFLIFGFSDNIRGTAIPRIQAEFFLSELHLGLLLAINSVGYLIGCTLTTSISDKIGIKYSHILGLVLIAVAGVFIFFAPNFPLVMASFFAMSFGFGVVEISVGVLAAKIFTKNTGTMMNLAHFAFGAGSVIAPMISTTIMMARFGSQIASWRYVYLIALSFALIPTVPLLIGRLKKMENAKKASGGYTTMLKRPTTWLVVLVLLFGLIAEGGMASWFVAFLESAHGFSGDRAALYLTLYYLSFTLARLILGPLIDRIGFINSLIISLAFAGVMILLGLVFGEGGAPLIVLAGIGVAPLFPTVMAVIAKLFLDVIEIAMTTIMTLIGILVIPTNFLMVGVLEQARSFFAGYYGEAGDAMAFSVAFSVFGISCLVSCMFALILRHRQKKLGKMV